MSTSVKRLAYTAVFVALAVVLNIFTIPIGVGSTSITFVYLPVFLSGVFFGPISGFAVGVLGDLLGQIIHPMGVWSPLITVGSGMIGLIAGLLFKIPIGKLIKKPLVGAFLRIFIGMFLVLVLCTAGLNTYGLWLIYGIGKKTFWVYLSVRLPFQACFVLLNAVVLCILYPVLQKILKGHRRI